MLEIKELTIDLETFSSVDLSKCGVYKYVESNDFEILLLSYSINGCEAILVDIASGEKVPDEIIDAIKSNDVIKSAFNSSFERICLSKFLGMPLGTYLNPCSWHCDMVWSACLGLPQSLKGVGEVLNIDKKKMDEGKELIRYFCVPCNPTKANGGRIRNRPIDALDKWALFKTYNKRDVDSELAIQEKLKRHPLPDFLWDEYHIDQEINDRGVLVDLDFVNNAITIDDQSKNDLMIALQNITNLENPNSVAQMKVWLKDNGIDTDDLGKKNVTKLRDEMNGSEIGNVLSLRLQLSKSSIKKYQAMLNASSFDNRVRGMFRFYGANRTGRFASRIVQLQNLPQNHLSDLEEARSLVKQRNIEALNILYENIPDTLSQLIRTAFIPRDGYKFIVADFSAIEARVIAWFAHEKWRLETFERGDDIYCASASQMFHVPVVKHGVNGELRQKGKIAELALGYGGSVGALTAMGAIDMGLKEEELKPLVDAWRASNPKIVAFWWDIDKLIKNVIKNKTKAKIGLITASYQGAMLYITLPSGRNLAYVKPRIIENQYGTESVSYEGVGSNKKWERLEAYGPKFVENIVQATARDILCNSMKNLRDYRIVAHVHDELIIECPMDTKLDFICSEMAKTPSWCKDLNLRADGYECMFYQKD